MFKGRLSKFVVFYDQKFFYMVIRDLHSSLSSKCLSEGNIPRVNTVRSHVTIIHAQRTACLWSKSGWQELWERDTIRRLEKKL